MSGADHTGYIKRISAAVKALSKNRIKFDAKVCQLVKLFKDGKPFKMSKRSGDFVTISEVLKEVDKDSIRFIMLSRSNDVELDFDFNKVLEKSKDNHVFYVQYCYARIKSLSRILNLNLNDPIKFENEKFIDQFEIKILEKYIIGLKFLNLHQNIMNLTELHFIYMISPLYFIRTGAEAIKKININL